jgi:hypothetical protein
MSSFALTPQKKEGSPSMQKEEITSFTQLVPEWIWKTAVAIAGALLIAIDYFLGYAYCSSWRDFFHVSITTYPLAREEYLIYGALAFRQEGVTLLNWSSQHKWPIAGMFLYLAFLIAVWSIAERFRPQVQKWDDSRSKQFRHHHLARFLARALLVAGCMVLFLAGIPTLSAVLALPGGLGEHAGRLAAQQTAYTFGRGCTKADLPCVVLKKDGKEIGKGFRIAQSKDRIALYANGVTTDFPLDGVTWNTVDHL